MHDATFDAAIDGAWCAVGNRVGMPERSAADVIDELFDATQALEVAAARARHPTWRDRIFRRQAAEAEGLVVSRFRWAVRALGRCRVGAEPKRWGLLSDEAERGLGNIIEYEPVSAELSARLADIREGLLEARVQAHFGNRELETKLTWDLATCLELPIEDDHLARAILHYLPGWARPIPPLDLDVVPINTGVGIDRRYFDYRDRRVGVTTLFVERVKTDVVRLSDITVEESRSGWGLGSAALEHLCRTADHFGLHITGKIVPRHHDEEGSVRLAGWYRRHGFEVTPTSSGAHLDARISRPPTSCAKSSEDFL